MKFAKNNSRHAFTLVEIMVAMILFSMVVAAIYSTWMLVMRATKVGQAAAVQAQRQRIALHTIEDALMCVQSFQSSQRYYSFVVENGSLPMLSIASRVPDVFPRNGKFGDFNQRRLTFNLEVAPEGGKNLVLRQNPILMDLDEDEKKYPLILARNVKALLIECWDKDRREWKDKWENTNSIPAMVRVGLVLGANMADGVAAPDFAVSQAYSIPSAMMPTAVQGAGAGGAKPGSINLPTLGSPSGQPVTINPPK